MQNPKEPAPYLDFDLSRIPAKDRFPLWHDHGSTVYRPLSDTATTNESLAVHSRIWILGSVTLMAMQASKQSYERTPAMIRQGEENHFGLVLLEKGIVHHRSQQQELTARAGDLVLLDMAQVAQSQWTSHAQLFAVFPRTTLSPARGKQLVAGRLAACQPQARLLASHLRTVLQELEQASALQRAALAHGLASLVSSYFSQPDQVEALTPPEEAEYLLGPNIRHWIVSQLHNQDLNAKSLARHFHLSRSGLYRLFESVGGVQCYIQEQRLTAAMLQLRDGLAHHRQLGELASSLGFSSASAFSHAFRRRWGISPRECQKLGEAKKIGADRSESEARWQSGLEVSKSQRKELIQLCQRYYQGINRIVQPSGPAKNTSPGLPQTETAQSSEAL